MITGLFEALGLRLASQWSADLRRRYAELAQSAKRTAIGVLLLQISGPFFLVGLLLLLTAMLLALAKTVGWIPAILWTGGASLLFGFMVALLAGSWWRR